MAQALDLKAFILRARVLKLYRHALRTARRAPNSRGWWRLSNDFDSDFFYLLGSFD